MFKYLISLIMVSVFFLTGCDDEDEMKKKQDNFKYSIACVNHDNSRDKFIVDDYYYQNKELTITYFDKERNANMTRTYLNNRCWIKPNIKLISEIEKLEYESLLGDKKINYVLGCRNILDNGYSKFYANKYVYDGYQLAIVDLNSRKLYKLLNAACVIDKV